jgi:predicted nucleotidyltransferase
MLSFRSKITQSILNYYFTNPQAGHYINELARILDLDPKNVDRKLKELEKEGILISHFEGKQRYFKLAEKSPLVENYKHLFESQFGVPQQLRKALAKVAGLKRVYIYGSYASGNFYSFSDIDVLAVGSQRMLDVQRAVLSLQKHLGREINIVNMSEKEFADKQKNNNAFIKNIFSHQVLEIL